MASNPPEKLVDRLWVLGKVILAARGALAHQHHQDLAEVADEQRVELVFLVDELRARNKTKTKRSGQSNAAKIPRRQDSDKARRASGAGAPS